MPHDKRGNPISVGDKVLIEGTVTAVQPSNEYCNLTVEIDPMPPYITPYSITLNTKQVINMGVEVANAKEAS